MKRIFYLVLLIWSLVSYGFTPPEVDSFPAIRHVDTTIVNVDVHMPRAKVIVNNDNSALIPILQAQGRHTDSLYTIFRSSVERIYNIMETDTPQTYMGYLTHATEYSEGQINKFIRKKWTAQYIVRFLLDIALLASGLALLMLIYQKSEQKINPSPGFVLAERIVSVLSVVMIFYSIGNMLSLFVLNSDVFRFEYLIRLLE